MNTNYQILMEEEIKKLTTKKTLLLHVCCAPCSSAVLEVLSNYFDITIFYYNPNTYPYNEYKKRFDEVIKLNNILNNKIKIIEGKYDDNDYYKFVEGLENEKEGGIRCHKCYLYRLEETAKYACSNNFDYFTTSLSVSPYKNSQVLNTIGKSLEQKYNVKYLYSDFKKKDGYKRSIELSKKYKLYRQSYCGCKYSINQNNY